MVVQQKYHRIKVGLPYKVYRGDGNIDPYKAWLLAKGFTQIYSIDIDETFSPIVKATTICFILEITVSSNWEMQQLDVNNAFLHGKTNETTYTEQSSSFQETTHPSFVYKLQKLLYGLKQDLRLGLSTFQRPY